MAVLRLGSFAGENRALHAMLLPEAVGATSINQKLGHGDLRPWRSPVHVITAPADTKTIYRMGREVVSDTNYWLTWPKEVHVARGPNAIDLFERTYYTGDGTPKWTDNNKALAALPYPTSARELGVPAPATAVLLSSVVADVAAGAFVVNSSYTIVSPGTTDFTAIGAANNNAGTIFKATGAGTGTGTASNRNLDVESRYYVYTYVTDADEESATSPPSLELICRTDANAVQITGIAQAPAGNYGINRVRIYRTQTGQSGDTQFFFLLEQLSTLTSAVDDGRNLAEVAPTVDWLTPPADLKWLTSLWNGMLAGISGRSVRFCESFKPYAWPLKYEILPTSTTPVALATFGQTLAVLTDGSPFLIVGGSPDAMDEQPMEFKQACIAPLSAVGMGHGVVWAAPDGLAYVGNGGAKLLTDGVMTRDDWHAINPSSIKACMHENRYFAFYTQAGVRKGFMMEPTSPQGIFFIDFGVDAVYLDDQQDALFVLDGQSIKKWDGGDGLSTTFRGKINHLPKPVTSFSCAEVVADVYPVALKVDAVNMDPLEVINQVANNNLLTAPNATTLRHTAIVTSRQPFRLPGGFMAQDFQIEVTATGPVQAVAIAHSMGELAQT